MTTWIWIFRFVVCRNTFQKDNVEQARTITPAILKSQIFKSYPMSESKYLKKIDPRTIQPSKMKTWIRIYRLFICRRRSEEDDVNKLQLWHQLHWRVQSSKLFQFPNLDNCTKLISEV